MRRARRCPRERRLTPAAGVHRPRRPQPGSHRTRLSVLPKQAHYSTHYASICESNIVRGTQRLAAPTVKTTKAVPTMRMVASVHDVRRIATEGSCSLAQLAQAIAKITIGRKVAA